MPPTLGDWRNEGGEKGEGRASGFLVPATKLLCITVCDREGAPEPHLRDRGASASKTEAGAEGWEAGLLWGSGSH